MVCFASGTLILTPAGEVPVERREHVAQHRGVMRLGRRHVLGKSLMEEAVLLRERRKSGRAVEQPLVDADPPYGIGGIQAVVRLLREIFEDGAGFAQRDPRAAGPLVIDQGGDLVTRADFQELGRELFLFRDVDRPDAKFQPGFLGGLAGLEAVVRVPRIQIDHRRAPRVYMVPRDFSAAARVWVGERRVRRSEDGETGGKWRAWGEKVRTRWAAPYPPLRAA